MSRSENGSVSPSSDGNNSTTSYQRLCHIVKRDDFDGYGFNLHSEKGKPGQYIGKVDENSPAEQAGLRQGDRIIEVNGVNIGNETHKQVVQRIKAIANDVRLLVIDPNQEKKINKSVNDSTTSSSTITSTITVQSSTVQAETTTTNNNNQKSNTNNNNNKDSLAKVEDNNIPATTSSTSPTTSVKSETNSASYNNNNINSNNKMNSDVVDTNIPQQSSTAASHQNGSTSTGTGSTNNNTNTNNTNSSQQQKSSTGLNLPMTAAEMRAKLLARKKYDPKNDSVDLRKKFEIIQKL